MKAPSVLLSAVLLLCGCSKKTVTAPVEEGRSVIRLANPKPSVSVSVPVRLVNNKCVVECLINGKKGRAIVDTGSDYNCVFADKLSKFGLQVLDKKGTGYSATGHHDRVLCSRFVLEFPNGISIENVNQLVLPSYYVPEIDAILGNRVLVGTKAVVDYRNMTLTFNAAK